MEQPRRMLILTADVGFGHRTAAEAIAAAARETYGDNCQIEVVNPLDDERTPAFLHDQQNDYDKLVRQMPDVYKFRYRISDAPVPIAILDSAFTVMLYRVVSDILKRVQPHVALTTYPFFMAPLSACFALQETCIPLLTVVTDLTHVHQVWFHDGADLCLVPSQETYEQALDYGLDPERVRVCGIPVHPEFSRQNREPADIRTELGWDANMTTVLVVGSKRVKNLMNVLNVLNHSGLPLQLILVAGGDEELYQQFQATEWHKPTHIYNFIDRMPVFMRAADLIVCKAGGLIVTEALASGLPLLIVDVTPGQEQGNAAYVVDHGAGELAETPLAALEVLFHWLDKDRSVLLEHTRVSRSLGRPDAAFTVSELAYRAAEEDCRQPSSRLLERIPRLQALLRAFDIPVT
jgi:1,2-diacylglycerol 3-beta-galactosyltransferase